MLRKYSRFILTMAILSFSAKLMATSAIIDGKWLMEHAGDDNLVILDIQPREYYQQYHVPGAISAPFATWKTGHKRTPPGMMLPIDKVALQLGKLGINENKQVVIVATGTGAGDIATAARVFWTLKVLGHKNVSILDGGLARYANNFNGPLSKQSSKHKATIYKPNPDNTIVADSEIVMQAIKANKSLLDARSRGEFLGVIKGGKDERAGTIPGAKNLPFNWVTINQSAQIRSKKSIQALFKSIEADKISDTIHFCHTGNRAALAWFVDYTVLGHKNARLYDGSMVEWAIDKSKPVKVYLPLTD